MGDTLIAWATHTENYLAGCNKVSDACTHCYAERTSHRFASNPHAPARYRGEGHARPDLDKVEPRRPGVGVVDQAGRWTGRVVYDPAALARTFAGLRAARTARRVFLNSMSDTFHRDAPAESLRDLATEIRATTHAAGERGHVLLLLTKRPDVMLAWQRAEFPDGLPPWVWPGTTTEHDQAARSRIPTLLLVQTSQGADGHGGVRWLSAEPLLGPIGLLAILTEGRSLHRRLDDLAVARGEQPPPVPWLSEPAPIGWVILGCESDGTRVGGRRRAGPRPTRGEWVRSTAVDAVTIRARVFVKQLASDWDGTGTIEDDGVIPTGSLCDRCGGTGLYGPGAPDSACPAADCDQGIVRGVRLREVPPAWRHLPAPDEWPDGSIGLQPR